jgi:hypothetical protein
VVALNIDGKAFYNQPAGPIVPSPANGGTIDQTQPPAPTGLKAAGALASIILTWDKPTYGAHSHTEVWSSGTNDIGTATMVGTSPSQLYVDVVGTGTKRYYWIKWVSKFPVTGPFNSTNGTEGETGYDASYLIDVLSANPPPGTNYNPLLYVQSNPNLVVDGVPIPVGTYMQSAYIANASITRLKVGLAAIDDARIANLSAAKITAGDIDADRMRANIVQAVQGQFVSLSAISAWLGTVTIGQFGYLRTEGVWDYLGGDGIFMGWHTDQYKFRVGNPGGDHIRYADGKLTIVGDLYSTGNGTFRGTFISGGLTGLYGNPAGSSGIYVGADGIYGGYASGFQDAVGGAMFRLSIGENLAQLAASTVVLASNTWRINSDGTARFRRITQYGDDGVTEFPKSASTTYRSFGVNRGASNAQVNLPGPAFVTVMMMVTAGSAASDYLCAFGPQPFSWDNIGQQPTYSGEIRAGLSTQSPEMNVYTAWVPAGTYYLGVAVSTITGGVDSTVTAWVQIDPA